MRLNDKLILQNSENIERNIQKEGTKWVRVILRGYNYDGGTLSNAFFDDVVLVNHGH